MWKSLKSQHNKDRRKGTPAKEKTTKNKSRKGKVKGNYDPWKWKNIPPSGGDPNVKKKDGKERNWCKNHQDWVLHSP